MTIFSAVNVRTMTALRLHLGRRRHLACYLKADIAHGVVTPRLRQQQTSGNANLRSETGVSLD